MTINFKKTLVSGLVAASLAMVCGSALAAANPVNVAVTFTGNVKDNTCDTPTVVNGNTIDFGIISQANFSSTAGTVGKDKVFSLSFTNCGSDAQNVDITFEGDGAADNASLANGTAVGDATGVGVKLFGGTGYATEMTINDPTAKASYTTLSSGGPHLINLKASAVQTTSATPSAGTLNTQGTLVVTYE
ncbi:type 1 fimbria pilin [Klebsiella oxytoca]|uniref:Type 1 fimbria pilin n=1 Tax=Klebsiella oxytoca TaxID=571 RepID=A0A318FPP5_KLEOX|nr:fimbrial protein [Klebsiella oxytoca]PXW43982.1 type 1 fimbria pilin [Klebsiella oxytoca]